MRYTQLFGLVLLIGLMASLMISRNGREGFIDGVSTDVQTPAGVSSSSVAGAAGASAATPSFISATTASAAAAAVAPQPADITTAAGVNDLVTATGDFRLRSTAPGIHLYGSIDAATVVDIAKAREEARLAAAGGSLAEEGVEDPAADKAFAELLTGTKKPSAPQDAGIGRGAVDRLENMIKEDQGVLREIQNRVFGRTISSEGDDLVPEDMRPPVKNGVTLPRADLFRSIRSTLSTDLTGCISQKEMKNQVRKDQIPCYGCSVE